MPKSVQRWVLKRSSSTKLPGSSSWSRRSRAVSFPSACWRWMRSSPPPSSAARLRRSSSSRFSLIAMDLRSPAGIAFLSMHVPEIQGTAPTPMSSTRSPGAMPRRCVYPPGTSSTYREGRPTAMATVESGVAFAWMPATRPSAAMKSMSRGMSAVFIQNAWSLSARIPERIKAVIIYAFGQEKLVRPAVANVKETSAGWMHFFIFWGFVILGLQITTMFGRAYSEHFSLPGLSPRLLGGPYMLLRDVMEVAVLVSIGVAFVRWLGTRPPRLFGFSPAEDRLRGPSHWEAYLILGF